MKRINKITVIFFIGISIFLLFLKYDVFNGVFTFFKYEIFGYQTKIPIELDTCFDMLDKMLGDDEKTKFKKTKEQDILMNWQSGYPWEVGRNQKEPKVDMRNVFEQLGLEMLPDLHNSRGKSSLNRDLNDSIISGIIITCYHRYLNNQDTRLMDEIDKRNNHNYHFPVINSFMLDAMIIISIVQLLFLLMLYLLKERFTAKSYKLIFTFTMLVWGTVAIPYVICLKDYRALSIFSSMFGKPQYPWEYNIYAYTVILLICTIFYFYRLYHKNKYAKSESATSILF